jgi:spore germination protein GerM
MWVILIAVVAVTAALSIPMALRAYRDSGLDELVREYRVTKQNPAAERVAIYQASLYYLAPRENGTLSLHGYTYEPDARSGLNGLLERLLIGPDITQIEDGSISLIPDQTRLLGTSIVDQAAYIELSKEFLTVGPFGREGTELASRQIAETATSLSFIAEAVIIVDESVIHFSGVSSY